MRRADRQVQSGDMMLMDMGCESGLRQGLGHAVRRADRQIQSEDMMLMDMGCEYYGYDRRAARSARSRAWHITALTLPRHRLKPV